MLRLPGLLTGEIQVRNQDVNQDVSRPDDPVGGCVQVVLLMATRVSLVSFLSDLRQGVDMLGQRERGLLQVVHHPLISALKLRWE